MDGEVLIVFVAKVGFITLIAISLAAFLYRLVTDALQVHVTRNRYIEVQHRVMHGRHGAIAIHTKALEDAAAAGTVGYAPAASRGLQPAPTWLLELYNNQIEKYQADTQQRASFSFFFALLAMTSGLGFVVWAGNIALTNDNLTHTAGAAFISTIGATLSGYIAKTFSDLHRASLDQLNRYFRQPVLNEHVLTVERLAEQLSAGAREKAYIGLIEKLLGLMSDANAADPAIPGDTTADTNQAAGSAPAKDNSGA